MANQRQLCETYNDMDNIFRMSFGENADITCAIGYLEFYLLWDCLFIHKTHHVITQFD